MKVDFGLTATDYAQYRVGFPTELFARLVPHGIGISGQRILDLGTGTGALGRGFALQGCQVTGLDVSGALLEQGRLLDAAAGISVEQIVACAEKTGLPNASFDVVTAGTCWHWFDRPRAAAEAHRVLRSGGVLLMAHFDWIPLPGNVVEATERVIVRHNPQWTVHGGNGMHTKWFLDLSTAGFRHIESFSFDVDVPYSHEAWRGRIRASAGVAASLPREAVEQFDADHAAMLQTHFGDLTLQIPHRVFVVWGRAPL